MTPYPRGASYRGNRGQPRVISPGVHIAGVGLVESDLVHPLGMCITELPYALVPVEHSELSEQGLGKQHRMPRATTVRDPNDRLLVMSPTFDDRGDSRGLNPRLISQNQDH